MEASTRCHSGVKPTFLDSSSEDDQCAIWRLLSMRLQVEVSDLWWISGGWELFQPSVVQQNPRDTAVRSPTSMDSLNDDRRATMSHTRHGGWGKRHVTTPQAFKPFLYIEGRCGHNPGIASALLHGTNSFDSSWCRLISSVSASLGHFRAEHSHVTSVVICLDAAASQACLRADVIRKISSSSTEKLSTNTSNLEDWTTETEVQQTTNRNLFTSG